MSRTTGVEALTPARKLTNEEQQTLKSLAELMFEIFCSLTQEERGRYDLQEQLLAA